MHTVTFYPVGNGDCSQVVLANGRRLLFDFRHTKSSESDERPEIDLRGAISKELADAGVSEFDVVAFTHADLDHIGGSSDFFELRHAAKYQGGGRVKIRELWVPAAMVLETAPQDGQDAEFVIWRQEARYRLKEGSGIRVFSKPALMKNWLEANGLTIRERRNLFVDAGSIVPGFSLDQDGVEFFCHSPFIRHTDDGDDLRNAAALILNVRFKAESETFDYLAIGDSDWETLTEIVTITVAHGNEDRLAWDLFNVPHHCSYLALSDEKGERITAAKPGPALLLTQGRTGAYMVSSSLPIPDNPSAREQKQPPHVQARRCYEQALQRNSGSKLFVTMEQPNTTRPEPIVFQIGGGGVTVRRPADSGRARVVGAVAPRAGRAE